MLSTRQPRGLAIYSPAMKVLFIGDVVGEPGRRAVRHIVPRLRQEHGIDLVIANGENAAGGSGLTLATAGELFAGSVDIITSGDHLWDQKEIVTLLHNEPRFIRPLNYPPGVPGQGSTLFHKEGFPPVAIVNVQGRVFMPDLENPFLALRAEVDRLRPQTRLIIVDVHAEATSEKIALARMVDGEVSAVIGTHTHVQTADEQIFPNGTAYLTDAGFTGPHDSVIGRKTEAVLKRFLTNMPQRFEVAANNVLLQGALLELDPATGKAIGIRRVSEAVGPT